MDLLYKIGPFLPFLPFLIFFAVCVVFVMKILESVREKKNFEQELMRRGFKKSREETDREIILRDEKDGAGLAGKYIKARPNSEGGRFFRFFIYRRAENKDLTFFIQRLTNSDFQNKILPHLPYHALWRQGLECIELKDSALSKEFLVRTLPQATAEQAKQIEEVIKKNADVFRNKKFPFFYLEDGILEVPVSESRPYRDAQVLEDDLNFLKKFKCKSI